MYDFDLESARLEASKHSRNTWMRKCNWDYHDLRAALRDAYRVEKAGRSKHEAYVRKKGEKKLVFVFDSDAQTVFVITGAVG